MAAPVDAGSIYSDVRIRLDKLNGDIKAVNTGFDKLGKSLRTNSDKTTKTQTENFNKFKLSGVAAIAAVTLAFKQAITVFASTEQALANVQAVSNATAKEFKELEDAAESAGTTTRFTAGQAADALFFLSSAGLSATESVKALDGVLALAGATGSDLSQSAQTITSTLSQFGLAAEKAADVANVFAAANSNSQATLDKLQGSLRQVGPVAAGLGIELEEVVGSLQALFNAGFQGESAGRALKSALADLANEASPTIEKLEALGVSFADVNPEAVGLTSAIGALERAGLSTAQVIDAFGKVAGPQLVTLIGAGEAALTDYENAVTGTQEAARQYAVQNDTLSGSIDALKSAVEGTSNSFIETLAPVLRAGIDLFTNLLRIINKIPDVFKGLGAGAAGAATGVLVITKALALLGVTIGSGPLAPIVVISALSVGLVTLIKRGNEVKQQRLAEEFGNLATEMGLAGQEIDEFTNKAGKIEKAFQFLQAGGVDLDGLKENISGIAAEFELTEDQIIKIGLASKEVTEEFKAQLSELQKQTAELQIIEELADTSILQEEKLFLRQQARLEIAREQAIIEADAAESERKRIESAERLEAIKGRLITLDELALNGAITESQALEEKKALREEEISLLLDQALASGVVTDQILEDIETQTDAIENYSKRLKELEEENTANVLIESSKRATAYENSLRDSEFAHRSFTELIVESESELTLDLAENWLEYGSTVSSIFTSLYSSLVDLRKANADAEISEIDRVRDAEIAAVDERTQSLLESLGLAEETQSESLARRLQEALDAGDTETAGELSQEIERERILQEAEDEKAAIELAAAKESAQLKYEAEIAAWNFSKVSAAFTGAEAAVKAFNALAGIPLVGPILGGVAAAAVGVTTGIQIAAINRNKPQLPALQTGGIVLPSSGGTAAIMAENGAPELALNAGSEGEALLQQFATKVADAGSAGGSFVFQLVVDGRKQAESVVRYVNNGIVKLEMG